MEKTNICTETGASTRKVTTAISVKSVSGPANKSLLPWSADSADRETVNFHNFHMAQRWDHLA